MTTCRWDSETADYLVDGEPCRHDDYGDVTKHCTARRTCSQHIGPRELTCARCLLRTRQDIKQIVERAALMLPEALVTGVNSEAATLAGPAADVEAWSWRKITAKQGRAWHLSLDEEDDEWHPFTVLTNHAWLISNSYGGDIPDVWNVTNAAAYLDRVLHRVAHDDDQDWPQMAREMRKCRTRLESVLHDSLAPERGAPCPTCVETGTVDPAKVRLTREFSHWCTNDDCTEQYHPVTEDFDTWHCPRNRDHWWTAAGYGEMINERKVGA